MTVSILNGNTLTITTENANQVVPLRNDNQQILHARAWTEFIVTDSDGDVVPLTESAFTPPTDTGGLWKVTVPVAGTYTFRRETAVEYDMSLGTSDSFTDVSEKMQRVDVQLTKQGRAIQDVRGDGDRLETTVDAEKEKLKDLRTQVGADVGRGADNSLPTDSDNIQTVINRILGNMGAFYDVSNPDRANIVLKRFDGSTKTIPARPEGLNYLIFQNSNSAAAGVDEKEFVVGTDSPVPDGDLPSYDVQLPMQTKETVTATSGETYGDAQHGWWDFEQHRYFPPTGGTHGDWTFDATKPSSGQEQYSAHVFVLIYTNAAGKSVVRMGRTRSYLASVETGTDISEQVTQAVANRTAAFNLLLDAMYDPDAADAAVRITAQTAEVLLNGPSGSKDSADLTAEQKAAAISGRITSGAGGLLVAANEFYKATKKFHDDTESAIAGITSTTAGEVTKVTAAGNTQVNRVKDAATDIVGGTKTDGTTVVNPGTLPSAGNAQVKRVTDEGDKQVGRITDTVYDDTRQGAPEGIPDPFPSTLPAAITGVLPDAVRAIRVEAAKVENVSASVMKAEEARDEAEEARDEARKAYKAIYDDTDTEDDTLDTVPSSVSAIRDKAQATPPTATGVLPSSILQITAAQRFAITDIDDNMHTALIDIDVAGKTFTGGTDLAGTDHGDGDIEEAGDAAVGEVVSQQGQSVTAVGQARSAALSAIDTAENAALAEIRGLVAEETDGATEACFTPEVEGDAVFFDASADLTEREEEVTPDPVVIGLGGAVYSSGIQTTLPATTGSGGFRSRQLTFPDLTLADTGGAFSITNNIITFKGGSTKKKIRIILTGLTFNHSSAGSYTVVPQINFRDGSTDARLSRTVFKPQLPDSGGRQINLDLSSSTFKTEVTLDAKSTDVTMRIYVLAASTSGVPENHVRFASYQVDLLEKPLETFLGPFSENFIDYTPEPFKVPKVTGVKYKSLAIAPETSLTRQGNWSLRTFNYDSEYTRDVGFLPFDADGLLINAISSRSSSGKPIKASSGVVANFLPAETEVDMTIRFDVRYTASAATTVTMALALYDDAEGEVVEYMQPQTLSFAAETNALLGTSLTFNIPKRTLKNRQWYVLVRDNPSTLTVLSLTVGVNATSPLSLPANEVCIDIPRAKKEVIGFQEAAGEFVDPYHISEKFNVPIPLTAFGTGKSQNWNTLKRFTLIAKRAFNTLLIPGRPFITSYSGTLNFSTSNFSGNNGLTDIEIAVEFTHYVGKDKDKVFTHTRKIRRTSLDKQETYNINLAPLTPAPSVVNVGSMVRLDNGNNYTLTEEDLANPIDFSAQLTVDNIGPNSVRYTPLAGSIFQACFLQLSDNVSILDIGKQPLLRYFDSQPTQEQIDELKLFRHVEVEGHIHRVELERRTLADNRDQGAQNSGIEPYVVGSTPFFRQIVGIREDYDGSAITLTALNNRITTKGNPVIIRVTLENLTTASNVDFTTTVQILDINNTTVYAQRANVTVKEDDTSDIEIETEIPANKTFRVVFDRITPARNVRSVGGIRIAAFTEGSVKEATRTAELENPTSTNSGRTTTTPARTVSDVWRLPDSDNPLYKIENNIFKPKVAGNLTVTLPDLVNSTNADITGVELVIGAYTSNGVLSSGIVQRNITIKEDNTSDMTGTQAVVAGSEYFFRTQKGADQLDTEIPSAAKIEISMTGTAFIPSQKLLVPYGSDASVQNILKGLKAANVEEEGILTNHETRIEEIEEQIGDISSDEDSIDARLDALEQEPPPEIPGNVQVSHDRPPRDGGGVRHLNIWVDETEEENDPPDQWNYDDPGYTAYSKASPPALNALKPDNSRYPSHLYEYRAIHRSSGNIGDRVTILPAATTINGRRYWGVSAGQAMGNPLPDFGTIKANVRGLGLAAYFSYENDDGTFTHEIWIQDRLVLDTRLGWFSEDWVRADGKLPADPAAMNFYGARPTGSGQHPKNRPPTTSATDPHIAYSSANPQTFMPDHTGVKPSLRVPVGDAHRVLQSNGGAAFLRQNETRTILGMTYRIYRANTSQNDWVGQLVADAEEVHVGATIDSDNRYHVFAGCAEYTIPGHIAPSNYALFRKQVLTERKQRELEARLDALAIAIAPSVTEHLPSIPDPELPSSPDSLVLTQTGAAKNPGGIIYASGVYDKTSPDGTPENPKPTSRTDANFEPTDKNRIRMMDAILSDDGANEYHVRGVIALANVFGNNLLGSLPHNMSDAVAAIFTVHDGIGSYHLNAWIKELLRLRNVSNLQITSGGTPYATLTEAQRADTRLHFWADRNIDGDTQDVVRFSSEMNSQTQDFLGVEHRLFRTRVGDDSFIRPLQYGNNNNREILQGFELYPNSNSLHTIGWGNRGMDSRAYRRRRG